MDEGSSTSDIALPEIWERTRRERLVAIVEEQGRARVKNYPGMDSSDFLMGALAVMTALGFPANQWPGSWVLGPLAHVDPLRDPWDKTPCYREQVEALRRHLNLFLDSEALLVRAEAAEQKLVALRDLVYGVTPRVEDEGAEALRVLAAAQKMLEEQ